MSEIPESVYAAGWMTSAGWRESVDRIIAEYERLCGASRWRSRVEKAEATAGNAMNSAREERSDRLKAEADLAAARVELSSVRKEWSACTWTPSDVAAIKADLAAARAELAEARITDSKLASARAEVLEYKESLHTACLRFEVAERENIEAQKQGAEWRQECAKVREQLAAAQATIAGQGEKLKMLEDTVEAKEIVLNEATDYGQSVRRRMAKAEQALTRAGYTRCDGELGWKPPIGRKPLSLSVQRYRMYGERDSVADSMGTWICYADLIAWERGEGAAPDTTKAYGELITELIAAKDIIQRLAGLGIALTDDEFTPSVRPKYREIIRELATKAGVTIGIGPTAPESASYAGPRAGRWGGEIHQTNEAQVPLGSNSPGVVLQSLRRVSDIPRAQPEPVDQGCGDVRAVCAVTEPHPLIASCLDAITQEASGYQQGIDYAPDVANAIAQILEKRLAPVLAAAEAMRNAAETWSDTVDMGFASEIRPDIARRDVIQCIREYDAAVRAVADGGEGT